jgi:hypothetical protein
MKTYTIKIGAEMVLWPVLAWLRNPVIGARGSLGVWAMKGEERLSSQGGILWK